MKSKIYCLLVVSLTLLFVPTVSAASFSQKVNKAAKAAGIKKVKAVTAKIESVIKEDKRLTIRFEKLVRIGSQKTYELNFELDKPNELFDIPTDTKKVKVYWGYTKSGFDIVIALKKIR